MTTLQTICNVHNIQSIEASHSKIFICPLFAMKLQSQLAKDNSKEFSKSMSYLSILFNSVDISPNLLFT